MENKKIYNFVLLIGLFLISNLANSQSIYDVLTKDTLHVKNEFIQESFYKNTIFKDKIEIGYFSIKDANTTALKAINNEVKTVCSNYLNNELQTLGLYKELKNRLLVLNEMTNTRNDNYYNGNQCSPDIYQLTSIKCSAFSMLGNRLFFGLRFTFENQYLNSRYGDELIISHYYTADLESGKVRRWENKLSQAQIAVLQTKLSHKLNSIYTKMSPDDKYTALQILMQEQEEAEEWEEYEELSQDKIDAKKNENVCLRIDFSEADIFWFAWGIVIEFQDYTNSSKIYYGRGFHVFIPFDEAKDILSYSPEFSFLNAIVVPKTELRDINYQVLLKRMFYPQQIPTILDLIKINKVVRQPKTLSSKSQSIAQNGYVYPPTREKHLFDENGRLLNIVVYQDTSLAYEEKYTYNKSGNITSFIRDYVNGESNSETYIYDKQRNLIEFVRGDEDDSEIEYYFYNGKYVYRFSSVYSSYDTRRVQGVYAIYFGKDIICTETNSYLLNEKGDVIGIDSPILVSYQKQIGRDSLGRIIETHSDYDRRNQYWTYDRLGRLASYQNKKQVIQYLYKGESKLPFKSTNSNGNSTTTYDWEF